MTAGLLETIVAAARRASDARATGAHRDDVERAARGRRPARGFITSLSTPGIRVIAECKRRSPSRGILRQDYDPAAIARGYERAGAAAISVLTEPTFFDGAIDHLRVVHEAVALPVLRKDFLVTEFQILEARAAGADAVLLIAAALDDRALTALIDLAAVHAMAALVEVHDADELDRALSARAPVIGVNSRNLRTLDVSRETFDTLATRIPPSVLAVAESGLRSGADLARLARLGYRAFLVGERLMTDADPGAALAALLADADRQEPGR